jgi:two-component system sensor histidine kinase VicK
MARRFMGPLLAFLQRRREGSFYGNMAKIFAATGKRDTAEVLLQKSIDINSRPGYENGDAMLASLSLADIYGNTERYGQAKRLLDNVQAQLDSAPNTEANLRLSKQLYNYYLAVGDNDMAYASLLHYSEMKDSLEALKGKINQTNVEQFLRNIETEYRLKLLTKDNELNRVYLTITIVLILLTMAVIIFCPITTISVRGTMCKSLP